MMTVFRSAAGENNLNLVKYLLEQGADVHSNNDEALIKQHEMAI